MAVYALNQDVPLISMYSHQKNKILDEQILKGRNRYHNVFLIGRTEGLRALVKQFYPAWKSFPGEDAQADAQRMNRFIEERVREHPEQYFWLHKRFKTRPEGSPDFY